MDIVRRLPLSGVTRTRERMPLKLLMVLLSKKRGYLHSDTMIVSLRDFYLSLTTDYIFCIAGCPCFILVSDCVFYSEWVSFELNSEKVRIFNSYFIRANVPLVESLTQLAGPDTTLLLSYEVD